MIANGYQDNEIAHRDGFLSPGQKVVSHVELLFSKSFYFHVARKLLLLHVTLISIYIYICIFMYTLFVNNILRIISQVHVNSKPVAQPCHIRQLQVGKCLVGSGFSQTAVSLK